MKELIWQEIKRSPLSLLIALVSAVAGVGAFVTSLKQGTAAPSPTAAAVPTSAASYMIVVGALLGLSVLSATVVRFINAASRISAFFASIVAVVVLTLMMTLVVRSQGLAAADAADSSSWLIYWGVVTVFAAVNGETVLKDYAAFDQKTRATNDDDSDMTGSIVLLAVVIALWLVAVRWGQFLLAESILK